MGETFQERMLREHYGASPPPPQPSAINADSLLGHIAGQLGQGFTGAFSGAARGAQILTGNEPTIGGGANEPSQYDDSFWATDVPQAIGSGAAYLGAGIGASAVASGVGAAPGTALLVGTGATALLGGLSTGADLFERVKAANPDDEAGAWTAFMIGAGLVGPLDALPVGRAMALASKIAPAGVKAGLAKLVTKGAAGEVYRKQFLTELAKTGLLEGATEGAQEAASEATVSGITGQPGDYSRVLRNAGAGVIVGAMMAGVTQAAQRVEAVERPTPKVEAVERERLYPTSTPDVSKVISEHAAVVGREGHVVKAAPQDESTTQFLAARGLEPVYVDYGEPTGLPAAYREGKVLVDVRASDGERRRSLLTHELVHGLAERSPDRFKGLLADLRSIDSAGVESALNSYRAKYQSVTGRELNESVFDEESVANYTEAVSPLVQRVMQDPASLSRLFEKPGFASRMADTLLDLVNRTFGTKFDTRRAYLTKLAREVRTTDMSVLENRAKAAEKIGAALMELTGEKSVGPVEYTPKGTPRTTDEQAEFDRYRAAEGRRLSAEVEADIKAREAAGLYTPTGEGRPASLDAEIARSQARNEAAMQEAEAARVAQHQRDIGTVFAVGDPLQVDPESKLEAEGRRVVDSMMRVEAVERAIKASGSTRDTAEAAASIAGSRGNDLSKRMRAFKKEVGDKTSALDEYVMLSHAEARNAAIARDNPAMQTGSGVSTEEARARLAQITDPSLPRLARKLYALQKETMDLRVASGDISQEERAAWEAKYGPTYVPLIQEDDGNSLLASRKGYSVRGPSVHKAEGRFTPAESPSAAIFYRHGLAIERARKLAAGQAFLQTVRENPRADLWEENPGDEAPAIDTFVTKENGKEVNVWIKDPGVRRGMQAVASLTDPADPATAGYAADAWRKLQWLTRMYKKLATGVNPEFAGANLIRDTLGAAVSVGAELGKKAQLQVLSPKRIHDALHESYNYAKGKPSLEFQEYLDNGGSMHFATPQNFAEWKEKWETASKATGLKEKFAAAADWVEQRLGAFEDATRFNVYRIAVEAGKTPQQAASMARNASVNFLRRGEAASTLNTLYLFASANIAATNRLVELARKHPAYMAKLAASTAALGFTVSLLNRAFGPDDENGDPVWESYSLQDKTGKLVLMPPGSALDMRIPLPGPLAFSASLGRLMEEAVNSSSPDLTAPLIEAADMTNVLGKSSNALHLLSPWFLDPLVTVQTNEDQFGSRLMPDPFDRTKPDSQRAWSSVSPTAQAAASALNSLTGGSKHESGLVDMSPETIEYLGTFAGSGVGRVGVRMYKAFEKAAQGESPTTKDVPIIRTFIGRPDITAVRSEFYDALDEIQREHNTLEDPETRTAADRKLAALHRSGNLTRKRVKNLMDAKREDEARALMLNFNKRVREAKQ